MIELKSDYDFVSSSELVLSFHSSFDSVQEKVRKWASRFSRTDNPSLLSDLYILYLITSRKFLDHHRCDHLFRLTVSIYLMQKKLSHATTFFPTQRNLEIRWFPTILEYPFRSKPVLGCLIGFNVMDRYELFDEENVLLTLQKYLPDLRLVKDSSYCHASQHKNFKLFYFEIEKKDGTSFSLQEQKLLQNHLEDKVKNTIQMLSPTTFMSHNVEETYKNILVLGQEIESLRDFPQAYITLDNQTGKEIVFLVILVYIAPLKGIPFDQHFSNEIFVSERVITVKEIDGQSVDAHIFRFHFRRDASLLRSDGSLDFYSARQKVVGSIQSAIGEFRDYNGGIIIKQQELLDGFKEHFSELASHNLELIESFFYTITPLEKQATLPLQILCQFFSCFLENRKNKLPSNSYNFRTYRYGPHLFVIVQVNHSLMSEVTAILKDLSFKAGDIAYNVVETEVGVFLSSILQAEKQETGFFLETFKNVLDRCQKKMHEQQVLRIAMDYSTISLDPRIVGNVPSLDIIRLLFEGLTRFNKDGEIENAIAESIKISQDLKHYTFKLRPSFWNDGSLVSAYDFEYAWKKILSPTFKTAFAYLFYSIKNAQEAKAGKVSVEQVGIYAQDESTLKVELTHPTPYFLQLTTHPLYSPIHQLNDQLHPEWPYQGEKSFICNGPFQLKINQPNQGFKLVKNSFYWDTQQIILDQILFTYMNPAQAVQAFHKKEVDWIGNPFGVWDSTYNANKENKTISSPDSRVCWCAFNTRSFPFNYPKLRQAFAYAIERAEILSNAFIPLNPAYATLLPRHRNHSSPLFPLCDKEKAKKLFQEAIKELQISQDQFRFTLICNESGIQRYAAGCLKKQFEECFEIQCDVKEYAWSEQFKHLLSGNFDMGLVHWASAIDDPIYTLDHFRCLAQGVNFCRWEDSSFQNLIDLSECEIDPNKRREYLLEAEEILGKEVPIIPLYYLPYQALVRKDLQVNDQSSYMPFNIAKSFYKINQEV